MYLHYPLHTFVNISMLLDLLIVCTMSFFHLRRGEGIGFRQSLILVVAIGLMLAGSLMRGGPHDDAGSFMGFAGGIVLVVNALRFRQWRKAVKPAA